MSSVYKILTDNNGIKTPETIIIAAVAAVIGITVFAVVRSGLNVLPGIITSKTSSIVNNAGTATGW